jgi:hypothetical protein
VKENNVNDERPKVCPMGFHLLKGKNLPNSSGELKLVKEEPSQSRSFNNLDKVDADLIPTDPKLVEAA